MANEINQIKVGSTTYTLQDERVDDLVTGVSSVNSKTGDVSLGASDVNALPTAGGTMNTGSTITMSATTNANGANLKWGTVNSKNPYIGYASDQTDGTFVVGSLLGTNYASGLAIGGGSGNLLWKGTKVATTSDIPSVPTVNNGTLTIQKNGTSVGTFTANQSGNTTANIAVPTTASDVGAAPKKAGVYLVKGNTTGTAGTWTGDSSDFTDYYDGLVVAYDIGIAGASTTTLNINSNGAKTVYLRGTTKLTTHYAVGTIILLVYSADADCWYKADYDANTNTQVRVYRQDASGYNKDYPLIASRTVASSVGTAGTESSYSAVYGLISDTAANIPTTNPYTGEVKAKKLTVSGDISAGNLATVATSGAYSDLSGTPTFSFSNGVLTITT